MSEIVLHQIQPATREILDSGFFLVLLNADKKPPHVALLINGTFISLEASGPVVNQNTEALVRMIARKKIPSLFIELILPRIATMNQIRACASSVIQRYDALMPGVITCLAPVKDVVKSVYEIDVTQISFVYELLPALQKENSVGRCFHLNLAQSVNDDRSFCLRRYTMQDVIENIRRVSDRRVSV